MIAITITISTKVNPFTCLFFIINCYTTGLSKESLVNMLKNVLNNLDGKIYSDEIGLPIKNSDLVLPCGIYARYEKNSN